MREVSILGSTGSIGTQALDVIRTHPGLFRVRALGAGGAHPEILAAQVAEFEAPVVGLADPSASAPFQAALEAALTAAGKPGFTPEIVTGPDAMADLASRVPAGVVLNGITGPIGLDPTLSALESGATLALANKESLVVGGSLVKRTVQRPGQVVPVDSEHSALAQALRSGAHEKGLCAACVTGQSEVRRIILTASGGPFRGYTREQLAAVTPAQALQHPTWNMGSVVTINSATLFNKGLEVIEASLLFDVPVADIAVTVHPQSVIHSMIEFQDGSTIAQASPPDMRLPIALGLTWPERLENVAPPCDWTQSHDWHFEPLDNQAFPAVNLARAAAAASDTHPAVYTTANDICVGAFLEGRLGYLDIYRIVSGLVEEHQGLTDPSREDLAGVLERTAARTREQIGAAS